MSSRGTHYAGGAALGLLVGQIGYHVAGWDAGSILALSAVATATAGGKLSCDIDQYRTWRTINRWVPDEWLGGGGPLAHRGITHWVAWPLLIATGWAALIQRMPAAGGVWWLGYGAAIGWASHILLDALYGHAVRTTEGAIVVRRGVPLVGWLVRFGGVWTSGGPGSSFTGVVLAAAAAWQVWLLHAVVQAAIGGVTLLAALEIPDLLWSTRRRGGVRT